MLVFIWVFLVGACIAGTIDVKLEANWQSTPFKLNVLEAVSNYNESLYQPLVEKLMGVERDENETEELIFVDESGTPVVSDADFFDYAIKLIPSKEYQRIVEIEIANKVYSPRVAAHYNYYAAEVRDLNHCADDFVLFEANSDNLYCEPDAAFVLKTIDDPIDIGEVKLAIDHVLGSVFNRKIYTIYGDFQNPSFRLMFFHMYQLVAQKKLTLLWRYVDSAQNEKHELLSGYAAELHINKPLTIFKTDSDTDNTNSRVVTVEPIEPESEEELTKQNYDDVKEVKHFKLLGIQTTHFILNAKDKFKTLVDAILELPKYASFISSQSSAIAELKHIEKLAIETQSLKLPTGLYINGALIPDVRLNFFELIESIKREINFVNMFAQFNINVHEAREIMSVFANSVTQKFSPISLRYNTIPFQKIIGYINDIELDSRYKDFVSTKEAYSEVVSPGKLPLAKENIFDMVFVFDLADTLQLQYFMDCANRVIENKYPIRIGVVPLRDVSEYSEMATSKFFGALKTQGPSEAFTFLNMFNMFINSKEGLNRMTFRAMHAPYLEEEDKDTVYTWLDEFYKTFDIKQDLPLIIADGVFFSYNDINSALKQIFTDKNKLYDDFKKGTILKNEKFKHYIRKDALDAKNSHAIPHFLGDFRSTYGSVPDPLLYSYGSGIASLVINSGSEKIGTPLSLNFIGSLENENFKKQLIEAVAFAEKFKNPLKINVWDFSGSTRLKELADLPLAALKERLNTVKVGDISENLILSLKAYLHSFFGLSDFDKDMVQVIVAGRSIPLKTFLNSRGIESLAKFELSSRLDNAALLINKYDFDIPFNTTFDKYDFISWVISSTYFYPENELYFSEAVPRLNTNDMPGELRLSSSTNSSASEVSLNVELVIDPVTEEAQKTISFVPLLQSLDFVNLTVHLSPLAVIETENMPVNRFYKASYLTAVDFQSNYHIVFNNTPEQTQFSISTDVPQRWLVSNKNSSVDLNNVSLNNLSMSDNSVSAVFELRNILVEGYANGALKSDGVASPAGLVLELVNNDDVSDTLVMANYGYFQLQANPGLYNFEIKKGTEGDEIYEKNDLQSVWVTSFAGSIMKPVIFKKKGQELNNIIQKLDSKDVEVSFFSQLWIAIGLLLHSNDKKPQADINIFTITSGSSDERLLRAMIASVVKNTDHSVKFWFLENYMSASVKADLMLLSKHYGFEYELLMYKWPVWLRSQNDPQRTIWGYKILFLDVLFPQDLDKVILVEADQIVRTDLFELVSEELHDAPYAYVPMCNSREELEDIRYWKNGHWQEILGANNLKFHNSALAVIDLNRFRKIGAGDMIRQYYQRFSGDTKTLSILDQDLPNRLQEFLPIHSLDKSWLWCETFCSGKSFKDAKIIGVCKNPLIKESTSENIELRASEWNALDVEVLNVFKGKNEEQRIEHDEL